MQATPAPYSALFCRISLPFPRRATTYIDVALQPQAWDSTASLARKANATKTVGRLGGSSSSGLATNEQQEALASATHGSPGFKCHKWEFILPDIVIVAMEEQAGTTWRTVVGHGMEHGAWCEECASWRPVAVLTRSGGKFAIQVGRILALSTATARRRPLGSQAGQRGSWTLGTINFINSCFWASRPALLSVCCCLHCGSPRLAYRLNKL